jgi:hypothetical protein
LPNPSTPPPSPKTYSTFKKNILRRYQSSVKCEYSTSDLLMKNVFI